MTRIVSFTTALLLHGSLRNEAATVSFEQYPEGSITAFSEGDLVVTLNAAPQFEVAEIRNIGGAQANVIFWDPALVLGPGVSDYQFGLTIAAVDRSLIALDGFDYRYEGTGALMAVRQINQWGIYWDTWIEPASDFTRGHVSLPDPDGMEEIQIWFVSTDPVGEFALDNISIRSVPEPAWWAMLLIGSGGLSLRRSRHEPKNSGRSLCRDRQARRD